MFSPVACTGGNHLGCSATAQQCATEFDLSKGRLKAGWSWEFGIWNRQLWLNRTRVFSRPALINRCVKFGSVASYRFVSTNVAPQVGNSRLWSVWRREGHVSVDLADLHTLPVWRVRVWRSHVSVGRHDRLFESKAKQLDLVAPLLAVFPFVRGGAVVGNSKLPLPACPLSALNNLTSKYNYARALILS